MTDQTTAPADQNPCEPFRFTDADGDYLHIGIPATPANGGPAVSFHSATDPVHVPIERIPEVIAVLQRLVAEQTVKTEESSTDEPTFCSFGEGDAPGSGCILPAGHEPANRHVVTPGDADEEE